MENFTLEIVDKVAELRFNRPEKANALDDTAWRELKQAFEDLDQNPEARVILLTGAGKHWCAGIDLSLLMSLSQYQDIEGEGRKREQLRSFILHLQSCISAIEKCRKPVIAAIQGGCIGGGVDIATACDIRYAATDTYFTVKEVDLGLVADIGTLQRLPKIINSGLAYEMTYTGRKVDGKEAERIGLVARAYVTREEMENEVRTIAHTIARKSPLVIRGTKDVIQYSLEHSTADSLQYMATYNAAFLLSDDLMEAFQATMAKRMPTFKD